MNTHTALLQVVLHKCSIASSRIQNFDIRNRKPPSFKIPVSVIILSLSAIVSLRAAKMESDSITDPLQYFKDKLYFEPNAGVWDADIHYQLSSPGKLIRFKDSSIIFTIYESANQTNRALDVNSSTDYKTYIESSLAAIKNRYESQNSNGIPEEDLIGHTFQMSWKDAQHSGVWETKRPYTDLFNRYKSDKQSPACPAYAELWKMGLYNGIDIRYYSSESGDLEYDYILKAGADWRQIMMMYEGVNSKSILPTGELSMQTSLGPVLVGTPFVYQVIAGVRKQIACNYIIHTDGAVGFDLDESDIDHSELLIIDPVAIKWSTYFGGTDNDVVVNIQEDDRFIYVLFGTLSLDFPTTPGAFQTSRAGNQDLAVACFTQEGQRLWSTYIGGSEFESANLMIVDEGHVYILGESSSTDFPVSPGAFQTDLPGFSNLILTKLNKFNGLREWSTFLGGDAFEFGGTLLQDESNLYILAYSGSQNFPTTPGALQESPAGLSENPVLAGIRKGDGFPVWSTYFGTTEPIFSLVFIADALIDGSQLVVSGSAPVGLPVTSDALAPVNSGTFGGFWGTFDKNSGSLTYSSYLQNAGESTLNQIVNAEDSYIFFGESDAHFVPAAGAFQSDFGGGSTDLILVSAYKSNKQINWSTFLGGEAAETMAFSFHSLRTLADDGENIFISAKTGSVNFPTSAGAFQEDSGFPVGQKFVLASYSIVDGQQNWSTYYSNKNLPGDDDQMMIGLEDNHLYTVGRTQSTELFPSPNAVQTFQSGANDLFISSVNPENGYPECASYFGGRGNEGFVPFVFVQGDLVLSGNTQSDDLPVSVDALINRKPNDTDIGFVTRFTPCCSGTVTNTINPDEQEVCRGGTPQLLEGSIAVFERGTTDLLRNGILYRQDGIARPGQYQWQISGDQIIWEHIPGATEQNFQAEITEADRWYRRIIGCDTSDVVRIISRNLNAPIVNPGGPFINCPDIPFTVGGSPTVSGANGSFSIQWEPAAQFNDSQISNPILNTSQNLVLSVEVIDQENCRVVKSVPAFVIDAYTGSDRAICAGEVIRLGNTPFLNEPDITWQWTVISGDFGAFVNNSNVPAPLVAPDETTVFQLEVQGPDGCVFQKTVEITVDLPVQADAGPDLVLCQGETTILGTPSAGPDIMYSWLPRFELSGFDQAQPEFLATNSSECGRVTYILNVQNASGACPVSVDSVNIDIISADAGHDGCGPRQIGTADHSCGRYSYLWEVVSGDFGSLGVQQNLPQPFVNPNTPTIYRLTVSFNGKSCSSTVNVPLCDCPLYNIVESVPANCTDLVQQIPFCINLPSSNGYTISLLNQDAQVTFDGSQICLIQSIAQDAIYQIEYSLLGQSCTSTVTFAVPTFTIPVDNLEDIIICPATQTEPLILIGIPAQTDFTYSWWPANGLDANNISNPLLDWSMLLPGKNLFTLAATHIPANCRYFINRIIDIRSPLADAGPDRDFCNGIFTVLGTPGNREWTYQWSPGDFLNDPNIAQPELLIQGGSGTFVYTLKVTDPVTGCESEDQVELRIINDILAEAGADRAICSGQSTVLGSTNIYGPEYKFRWSPEIGLDNPFAANPIANPIVTTTYRLSIFLEGLEGCVADDEVTVTVNASGNLNVNIGPDQTLCGPGTITLGNPVQSGFVYSWTPENGLSDPAASQPVATITESITYTLFVVDTINCLTGTDNIQISLQDSLLLAGRDTMICSGDEIMIGLPAVAGVGYAWEASPFLAGINIAQPTVNPIVTSTFVLRATIGNCNYQDTILVTVLELPDLSDLQGGTICNDSIEIGLISPEAGTVYLWQPGPGLSSVNDPSPMAFPSVSTIYYLTAINAFGCVAEDSVEVINPLEIVFERRDYSVCLGESVTLGPTSSDIIVQYFWSPADFLSDPTQRNPVFTATAAGEYVYQLRGEKDGCRQVFEVKVIVSDPGSLELNTTSAVVCTNGCIDISINSDQDFQLFQWYPQSGVSNPNSGNVIICPDRTGFYVLNAINTSNSCVVRDSVFLQLSETIAPVANAGNDTTICVSQSLQLGSAEQTGIEYIWSPNLYLSGQTLARPGFTPPIGGNYSVKLEVYDPLTGCSNIDDISIQVIDINANIFAPDSVCSGAQFDVFGAIEIIGLSMNPDEFEILWEPQNALISQNGVEAIFSLSTSGIIYFTLNHLPSGCSFTAQRTVKVIAAPKPDINLPEFIYFCDSEQTFEMTLTPQPGLFYNWSPGTGLNSTSIANPTITVQDQRIDYTLRVTDLSFSEFCREVEFSISVAPAQIPMISDMDYASCPDPAGTILLDAGISANVFPLALVWTPSDLFTNPYDPIQTVPADSSRNFTVLAEWVSNQNEFFIGCQASASHTVNIFPEPVAMAGRDTSFCQLQPIQLGGPVVAGYQYEWSPIFGLNNPFLARPVASITSDIIYRLKVTDQNGCMDFDSIQILTSGFLLEVDTVRRETCLGQQDAFIRINTSGGAEPLVFTWTTTNGTGIVQGQKDQVALGAGTYQLVVTDSGGCSAMITVEVPVAPSCCSEFTYSYIPQDLDLSCSDIIHFEEPVIENHCCTGVNIVVLEYTLEGNCAQNYTVVRLFTITDDCNNIDFIEQRFFVTDTVAPIVSNCNYIVDTIECNGNNINLILTDWLSDVSQRVLDCGFDACDSTPVFIHNFDQAIFMPSCGLSGSYEIQGFLRDQCGNESQAITARLVIIDRTPPDISACSSLNSTVDCALGNAQTIATQWHQSNISQLLNCAQDACSNNFFLTHDFNFNNFITLCGQTGTLTATYRVLDVCMNSSSLITATLTISDLSAIDPADCGDLNFTVSCENFDLTSTATAWHLQNLQVLNNCAVSSCSGSWNITHNFNLNNYAINCGEAGTLGVIYTITDPCSGEVTVLTGILNVINDQLPQFVACGNLNIQLDCTDSNIETTLQNWHQQNLIALQQCAVNGCNPVIQIISNFNDIVFQPDCGGSGTYTVTYQLIDICGGIGDAINAVATVSNSSPPDISLCPDLDLEIDCDGLNNLAQIQAWHENNLEILSNCAQTICSSVDTIVHNFDPANLQMSCTSPGTLIVNYILLDACGLSSDTLSATLTILFISDPDLSDCVLDLDETIECSTDNFINVANNWHQNNLETLEICLEGACVPVALISHNFNPANFVQDCGETGMLAVTYQIMNACGGVQQSIVAILSIIDTLPPVITWNPNGFTNISSGDTLLVQCAANDPDWVLSGVTESMINATDNCGGDVIIEIVDVVEAMGDCEDDGYFFRLRCTIIATDECDNSDSLWFYVLIIDTIPPVILGTPADVTVSCDQIPDWPIVQQCPDDGTCCDEGIVKVMDACECATLLTEEIIVDNCEASYQILRIWIAEDNCGNERRDTQTITVLRGGAPGLAINHNILGAFEPGAEITYECDGYMEEPFWFAGLHEGLVTIVNDCVPGNALVTFSIAEVPAENCATDGFVKQWRLSWTATEACGGINELFYLVSYIDTQVPLINGLAEVCKMDQAVIIAEDLCSNVSLHYSDAIVPSVCLPGTEDLLRLWTAQDACGNTNTFEQRILNPQNPVLVTLIKNNPALNSLQSGDLIQMECQGDSAPNFGYNASDIEIISVCGHQLAVTFEEAIFLQGDCDFDGYLEKWRVTWSAQDSCAGAVSFVLFIEIIDTTAPEFIPMGDIMLTCGQDFTLPEATDNCSNVIIELIEEEYASELDCDQFWRIRRKYRATDECGNTEEQDYWYIVDRAERVIFSGLDNDLTCIANPIPSVIATDVCTGKIYPAILTSTTAVSTCGTGTIETRTWTATDDCGINYSIQQEVFLGDNVAPQLALAHPVLGTIQHLQSRTLTCEEIVDLEVAQAYPFTADDISVLNECVFDSQLNVDIQKLSQCPTDKNKERTTYTWVVTDLCGNSSSYQISILTRDVTGPVFLDPPGDLELTCQTIPPAPNLLIFDECSDLLVTYSETESRSGVTTELERVWIATDACDNVTEFTQLVTATQETSFECNITGIKTPPCNSGGNSLQAMIYGGMPPYQYHWTVSGGVCEILEGQGTDRIMYAIGFSKTSIILRVTDAAGCITSCEVSLECIPEREGDGRVGEDLSSVIIFSVYPIPAENELFALYTATEDTWVDITFYDMAGKEVLKQKYYFLTSDREQKINIASLLPGMYYIRFVADNFHHMSKVIKQ